MGRGGGGGGGGGGGSGRGCSIPTPTRLFFSILKPVKFKKLNGTGQIGLTGRGKFSNSPRLHFFFLNFFIFIYFYFYYIKIKNFIKIKIL